MVSTPILSDFADSLGAGTLAVHALAGVALVGPHVGLSVLVHHSLHIYALVRHCTEHIVEDQHLCVVVHKYIYRNVFYTIMAPVLYLLIVC